MDRFVARENIDHYLRLLNSTGLGPEKRATVTKLLIEEFDNLGHDLEQLEFAETRAASVATDSTKCDASSAIYPRLNIAPKRNGW